MNTSSFLLYGPLFGIGLVVLIGGAMIIRSRAGSNAWDSFKDFLSRVFGSVLFYTVSIGVAWVIGKILEHVVHPLILGNLPPGIDERVMATPILWGFLALGSLFIVIPDRWATSRFGTYLPWIVVGGILIGMTTYVLGIFPDTTMWRASSFINLEPWQKELIKFIWPPLYPGFDPGC